MAGAAAAALVMVAGIELVHRQTALKEDTGIGLLFVGMLALGVVIISRSDSYTGSLTAILFGDALGAAWRMTTPASMWRSSAPSPEGEYVVLHCQQTWPGSGDYAGIDIVRLDADGEVVEHWDVLQPSPEQSAHDNGLFSVRSLRRACP